MVIGLQTLRAFFLCSGGLSCNLFRGSGTDNTDTHNLGVIVHTHVHRGLDSHDLKCTACCVTPRSIADMISGYDHFSDVVFFATCHLLELPAASDHIYTRDRWRSDCCTLFFHPFTSPLMSHPYASTTYNQDSSDSSHQATHSPSTSYNSKTAATFDQRQKTSLSSGTGNPFQSESIQFQLPSFLLGASTPSLGGGADAFPGSLANLSDYSNWFGGAPSN